MSVRLFLGGAAVLLVLSPAAPRVAAATGPFEPNDSPLGAAGPLSLDQTYEAALETSGDSDYYFFYVSAARGSEVRIAIENLGGGSMASDIDATILDSTLTPLSAVSYIGDGETRTASVLLQPQRYVVEIAPTEGFGDTYRLLTAGTFGAFAPYVAIASRCAGARSELTSAKARLQRAKARLQRALGRLRRARYWGPHARRQARTAFRRAKARLASRRAALRQAAESQKPWCLIAP
jgi:hypothetical protein